MTYEDWREEFFCPKGCTAPAPETRSVEERLKTLMADVRWLDRKLNPDGEYDLILMIRQIELTMDAHRAEAAAHLADKNFLLGHNFDRRQEISALRAERDEARGRIAEGLELAASIERGLPSYYLAQHFRRILRGGESTEGET